MGIPLHPLSSRYIPYDRKKIEPTYTPYKYTTRPRTTTQAYPSGKSLGPRDLLPLLSQVRALWLLM
jgi:hypothetical protein